MVEKVPLFQPWLDSVAPRITALYLTALSHSSSPHYCHHLQLRSPLSHNYIPLTTFCTKEKKMSRDFSCFTSSFIPFTSYSSTVLNFELFLCFLLFLAVFVFWLTPGGLAWALGLSIKKSSKKDAPVAIPGPSGLPLLGLVFAFTGSLTHRVLEKISKSFKAETLMAFSVGFTRFIISSQPETAKEILNSSAFADRPVKESAYELLFHRAMGFAPYGEYWRNLRRISATHLFSPKRISCSSIFRSNVGVKMVEEIKGLMEKNGEVEVKKVLHFGSLNNVMTSVFGKRYDFNENGMNDDGGFELESLVNEGYELLGIFNWTDHFPVLGWLDMQGVRKRCRALVGRVNVFVGNIIEEHRLKRAENGGERYPAADDDEGSGDFVDVLLDLDKEDYRLSDSDKIAVLWVFFSFYYLTCYCIFDDEFIYY